ncbi:MAG: HYR domain-containing protein, partial [Bacteroidota bacterium]
NHPSNVYPVGTTTVTWTATDNHGHTATCTQDVVVTDNENPNAVCKNITVQLDVNHSYTVTAAPREIENLPEVSVL